MGTLLTVLISAGLSAVICFVLKTMDKENNTMDKVRRYADKRQSEFEIYFAEKSKQVKMHSAELESQQQMAVAAVKKLDGQINQFKEMIVSLENDKKAVYSLENKIASYGTKISELSEMTSAVEENLGKIKNESVYVTKVNSKIEESKASIDKLEKQIPLITQNFSKQNAEQLKNVGIELLKQYDAKAKQIEDSTKTAVGQYEEIMNKITSDVAGIYSNAAIKVEKLEDDAFKRLSKVSMEKADSYKAEVQKAISEIAEQLKEVQLRYNELYNQAISQADEKEKSAYEKYSSAAKTHIDTFKTNVEEKIHTMQDTIKQNVSDLKTQLVNATKDAKTAIAELKASCQEAVLEAKESSKEVNTHKNEVEAAIVKFEKEASSKIAEVNKRLEEAVKNATAVYDAKQAESLIQLDKSLESYKKDMGYRMQRLETSGADIDQLEKVLRKSMAETQNHVMADFKTFTDATKVQSENLAGQIAELEAHMSELRDAAISTLSNRLVDFENEITDDLKERGEKIDDKLASWKQSFDEKISMFTSDYETDRINIEEKYNESLKEKIDVLENEVHSKIDKLQSEISNSDNSIESQIEEMQTAVRDFVDTYSSELKTAVETSEETLKHETEKHAMKIKEDLISQQNELVDELDSFKGELSDKQKAAVDSIENAISDFNSYKEQINSSFAEAKANYDEALENLKTIADDKALEVKAEIDELVEQYRKDTKNRQEQIFDAVESLEDKSKASVAEYKEKSEEVVAQLESMYAKMLEETEERIKGQSSSAENKIAALENEIEKISNSSQLKHSDMIIKMQNQENELRNSLNNLNNEIKAVADAISVYEKAESMKRELDGEMSVLSESFERIEGFKVAASAFTDQFNALCSMNDEAEERLEKFNTARKQIDNLEKDFNRIIVMSGSMDDKIREMQATTDNFQAMEIKVRDFQESVAGLTLTFERLDKKQDVIDRVATDVDKSFEQLKDLEKKITNCTRQVNSLPEEIKDVQKNVDVLLKNTRHLDAAVDKLDSLSGMIEEAEERIEKVQNDREGIASAEERITKLSNEVDKKMSVLKAVTEADVKKNGTRSASRGPGPRKRENIRVLKQQGWTNEEIAKSLNLTLSEVELVLELPE